MSQVDTVLLPMWLLEAQSGNWKRDSDNDGIRKAALHHDGIDSSCHVTPRAHAVVGHLIVCHLVNAVVQVRERFEIHYCVFASGRQPSSPEHL